EMKLEVWDSPNSAGIVIDAVRIVKLALNHGIAGQLDGPSSYLMKSPHNQRPDSVARERTEEFIAKYARERGVPAGKAKSKANFGRGSAPGGGATRPAGQWPRLGIPPRCRSRKNARREARGVSRGFKSRGPRGGSSR